MSDNSPVLTGWSAIAKYLKVHTQTAMTWHEEEKMPVGRIKGYVVTTTYLLDRWIVKHVKVYMEEQKK